MYIVIRRYTGVIKPQDVISRVTKDFVPIISKTEGFRGYHLIDTGTDVLASVTMFMDKAAADNSLLVPSNWIRDSGVAALLPNLPQVTPGEDVA
ncbi:hypothetical protein [Devosia sp.]|uniref:hypothetical protein n=1 Tax=Devosia sp. TaxID=1871048 RepID=UPI00262F947C|nr:hypothetical protein [Devosia sp.]